MVIPAMVVWCWWRYLVVVAMVLPLFDAVILVDYCGTMIYYDYLRLLVLGIICENVVRKMMTAQLKENC
jgi:hypothetical protein